MRRNEQSETSFELILFSPALTQYKIVSNAWLQVANFSDAGIIKGVTAKYKANSLPAMWQGALAGLIQQL